MKNFILILALSILVSCQGNSEPVIEENKDQQNTDTTALVVEEVENNLLLNYPLITWLRKNPAEIGCMLETELNYKDEVFNCSYQDYTNPQDPCGDNEKYYEGLIFPENFVSYVHPNAKTVELKFERGMLRELRVEFKDNQLKTDIASFFELPSDKKDFPTNIIDIGYGENTDYDNKPTDENYTRWITIEGFEHTGRGDVDCE